MSGHPYLLSMFLTPFFYMNWLIQWILIYKHWTTIMCLKTALSMMAASPTSCPSGACGATGAAAACDVEAVWEQGGLKNGTFWVRYPVPSLKLTYPIPFMGLVYLPTWMCVCFYGLHVGKYTSPMDSMGTVDGSEIPNNHLECIKPSK